MGRRTVAAVALVVTVLVTGCGGDDEEPSAETATSSTEGEATADRLDPSPSGAQEFCEGYQGLAELAELPRDTIEELRATSEESVRALEALSSTVPGEIAEPFDVLVSASRGYRDAIAEEPDLAAAESAAADFTGAEYEAAQQAVDDWSVESC